MRLQAALVCGSQAPGGELAPQNKELAVTVEPVSPCAGAATTPARPKSRRLARASRPFECMNVSPTKSNRRQSWRAPLKLQQKSSNVKRARPSPVFEISDRREEP